MYSQQIHHHNKCHYIPLHRPTKKETLKQTARALWLAIPGPGWLTARKLRLKHQKPFRPLLKGIHERRMLAIQQAIPPSGFKIPRQCDEEFGKLLMQLKHQVEHPPQKNLGSHLVKIQTTLTKIANHRLYRKSERQTIEAIQGIAVAIRTKARGMHAFEQYGQQVIASLPNEAQAPTVNGIYTWNQYGALASHGFNAGKHRPFDTVLDRIIWGILHPKGIKTGIETAGALGTDPVHDFNPFKEGNFNVYTGDYVLEQKSGKTKMRFFHGPGCGIATDRLADLHIDHLKSKGGVHLQHSLEHPQQPGELPRLQHIKKLQDNSKGRFRFLATPLNGYAWEGKGQFSSWKDPQEFFSLYKQFAIGTGNKKAYREINQNGFYIGPGVMSDAQFEKAFDYCQTTFDEKSLLKNTYYQKMMNGSAKDKKLVAQGMQIFLQAMVASGAIAKTMKDAGTKHKDMLTFAQACTADVDRGLVLNMATRLLFMRYTGQKLTKNVVEELVGTTLGRAELAKDRRIMRDKFEPLMAFVFLLGSHHDAHLDNAVRGYLDSCFLHERGAVTFQSVK